MLVRLGLELAQGGGRSAEVEAMTRHALKGNGTTTEIGLIMEAAG